MVAADRPGGVLVAGAGIAGLASALALDAKGFRVTLLERNAELSGVGAGLQLSPNATRLLRRLGVLDRLAATAVRPERITLRSARDSRTLLALPLGAGAEERWGAPYLVCHRADLQEALLAQVRQRTCITLRLGQEAVDQKLNAGEVEVRTGEATLEYGDLLVAADGVWSRIAASILGRRAVFSGYIAWRMSIAARNAPQQLSGSDLARSVTAWLGPTGHLIAYPVRAGEILNLVAVTPGAETGASWQADGDAGVLASHFAGWHKPVRELVELGGRPTCWPLFGMPGGPWTAHGRLVLVGDAAHAMTPFAAQGAAMAIEDACALAAVLGSGGSIVAGLARFEAMRKPRIEAARRRGSLNRFAYHASGATALARNAIFRLRPARAFLADLDWLYGYDGTGF